MTPSQITDTVSRVKDVGNAGGEDGMSKALALLQEMKENFNILISGKWHRVCFSPALTITSNELEMVITAFIKTFKDVASKWDENYRAKIKVKPIF